MKIIFETKWLLVVVLLLSSEGRADEINKATDKSDVERFAEDITGVIWDLRGTSSLKRIRYDGGVISGLNRRNQAGRPYDTAVVDTGVIRLNYSSSYTGWYFFSDDLKWVTPVKASGEIAFELVEGVEPKRIRKFPEDIKAVVWESKPDERGLNPTKIRWDGSTLEFGVKKGSEWQMEKLSPVIANRRVFELVMSDASVIWLAFSASGKEAWFIQGVRIYGGHAKTVKRNARLSAAQTGLSVYHADLANHAEDLKSAGEVMRMEGVKRELLRSLSKKPELVKKIEQRLRSLE
ncbi:MAG: hypothetical protein QM496_21575 [Verrucomicrobiota bacterium]